MNGKFFLAAIPEPHTVLGLRLRPFSAGHIILLHRSENAFVTGGIVDETELCAAAFICAHTYEQNLAAWSDKGTEKEINRWRKKLGKFDLAEKLEHFARYVKEGSTVPTYSATESKSSAQRHLDLPYVQVVKCVLMEHLGISETEFLNRPWGLSRWDCITLMALEGQADIFSDDKIKEAMEFANSLAEKLNGGAK